MKDMLTLKESWMPSIERNRSLEDLCDPWGRYVLEHHKQLGKSGKYHKVSDLEFPNGVVDVGKAYMLNAAFNSATQSALWYLGLIDGSTTPTLSNSDTMASHTGWVEFLTYTESVRQTWVQSSASGGIVTATSAVVFTIGAVASNTFVAGGFLCNSATKTGTTGILWSTGLYANPAPVSPTDIFKLNYITGL